MIGCIYAWMDIGVGVEKGALGGIYHTAGSS